jgi:hypothetical protein
MRFARSITKAADTLLFHSNNGYVTVPQNNVICILPVLFKRCISAYSRNAPGDSQASIKANKVHMLELACICTSSFITAVQFHSFFV